MLSIGEDSRDIQDKALELYSAKLMTLPKVITHGQDQQTNTEVNGGFSSIIMSLCFRAILCFRVSEISRIMRLIFIDISHVSRIHCCVFKHFDFQKQQRNFSH